MCVLADLDVTNTRDFDVKFLVLHICNLTPNIHMTFTWINIKMPTNRTFAYNSKTKKH